MKTRFPRDLNNERIHADGTLPASHPAKRDNSLYAPGREVEVYFRNLEAHLVYHVEGADFVVGCVAWLTSEPILAALAGRPKGCSILVQKEDFLRPDAGDRPGPNRKLRRLYDGLRCELERHQFRPLLCHASVYYDQSIDPVRCVGIYNRTRTPAAPRMHHKFVVFCKVDVCEAAPLDWETVRPYAVWTGSFNFTKNATFSFENAVLLRQPDVVEAYYLEWQQISMLGEPLDWEADWVQPEWWIGT